MDNIRRFGGFVLDVNSRQLHGRDRATVLQHQPFAILCLLLDRAGKVVEREERRQRLWPAGIFVDYEHSLNAAVKRLRRALGDNGKRSLFIETIPRLGYRLVAPVAETEGVLRRKDVGCLRLAVMPFAVIGGADEFAKSLAAELNVQVARVGRDAVAVIGQSSTPFAEPPRRISSVRDALQVDYVVEGSVRGVNDVVRVTAALVDARHETCVWTTVVQCRLTSSLGDATCVAVQLAQSIVETLSRDVWPQFRDRRSSRTRPWPAPPHRGKVTQTLVGRHVE
jgi:DNA-binding winged helix-turn-helix (wHTH) protein